MHLSEWFKYKSQGGFEFYFFPLQKSHYNYIKEYNNNTTTLNQTQIWL